MPRRPVKKSGTRPAATSIAHSPAVSLQSTPTGSAFTSTYGSELEVEVEDPVATLNIASLTLDVPLIPFNPTKRAVIKPFLFLELPSELRVRIYEYFFDDIRDVLDLGPGNHKRIHKKLGLMRVCRQIHDEATHFFYSTRTFRLFPTYPGPYFKSKRPLLARLKPIQRKCLTAIELRLGPGWNAPPRGWIVNEALGLQECINVRQLNVFVECDPSDGIFKGFRISEDFYESFCCKLLGEVLSVMPAVDIIEFDAWSSVKKSGRMMLGLLRVAAETKRLICWGPQRGWTAVINEDDSVAEGMRFVEGVSIPGYVSSKSVAVA